ncbi:hypothetical protein ACH5RR_009377 [Cinchona calisaya]|uniref:Uncharacterized protein n=1 Tax=Cinchona calisaya TaxID=153742 RepID=A0ABD3AHI4_9GENT
MENVGADVENSRDQKGNLMDTISCPSRRIKNLTLNGLEGNLVVGLPAQNICKRGKGIHGKKKSIYDIVKSHSFDLDPKDIVDDDGELNCVRGCDLDGLDEIPKLAQERGNSAQYLNDILVDNLMTHGVVMVLIMYKEEVLMSWEILRIWLVIIGNTLRLSIGHS